MARHNKMKAASWNHGSGFAKVDSLPITGPFCYRYRLEDAALFASIKKLGILMPLVVTNATRPVVIAGHKRLHAARLLKMKTLPVCVTGPLTQENAFFLNLVSNWKQHASEADRAKALGIAVARIRLKERDLLSSVMPLLGLPEDPGLLDLYLKVDRFSRLVKDLIETGDWSLRSLAFFFKLDARDQQYFAQEIGRKVRLTQSQLSQAGEWLVDLLKQNRKTLAGFFKEHKILQGIASPGMDPRTRADRFFAKIKQLRFPGYARHREEFESRRKALLGEAAEFRLEPIQGFEEPGFELHSRIKNAGDLDRLIRKISGSRPALNSLFEIAL